MPVNMDHIKALIERMKLTRDHELNCNEFLDRMAEYAEFELSGSTIPEALEVVEHHLELCPECREEYEALLKALKAGT